LPEVKI